MKTELKALITALRDQIETEQTMLSATSAKLARMIDTLDGTDNAPAENTDPALQCQGHRDGGMVEWCFGPCKNLR